MLDAYIIDRIRREREERRKDEAFVPLRIEAPRAQPEPEDTTNEPAPERGSVVIDFNL